MTVLKIEEFSKFDPVFEDQWNKFNKIYQIPKKFQNCHIDNLPDLPQEKIEYGKSFIKNPKSLVLYGDTGRAKTSFAYALLRGLLSRFNLSFFRWIAVKDLDDKIADQIKTTGSAKEGIIKSVSEVEILFLDDFGINRDSERAERDFYEIIDKRWGNELITVISTNLNYKSIHENFGSRIISRLKDSDWMEFDGKDLRGKK